MRIRLSRDWHPGRKLPGVVDHGNRGGDLVVQALGWWVRLAVYAGSPPGSHIGVWRTRWCGLYGLNVRVGRRYIGPCVTAFIHTQRKHP